MNKSIVSMMLVAVVLVAVPCQGIDLKNLFTGGHGSKPLRNYSITSSLPSVSVSIGGSTISGNASKSMINTTKIDQATFVFPGNKTFIIPKEKLDRDLKINIDTSAQGAYQITLTDWVTGEKEVLVVPN